MWGLMILPASRLIDDIKLVHAVERVKFVASLGSDGQTGTVLVEVDEVDVEVFLLHHFLSSCNHRLCSTHKHD